MRDRKSDTSHRRAAEIKLGRKLKPGEVVDHLDENKSANKPANLDVKGRGEHTRAHNKTRPLSKLRRALRAFSEGRKDY